MASTLTLVSLFAFGIALQESMACPNTWLTFNGMCYSFNQTRLNWFHATRVCKEQGGWLVEINSNEELSFLKNEIKMLHAHDDPMHVGYWTSGNDLETEGQWVWGYPKKATMNITDWSSGEPNNLSNSLKCIRGEDCLVMWGHDNYGYKWNDQPCDLLDYFICETEDISAGLIG